MNLENLEAQMNATVILTIYYKDLNPLIINEIEEKGIILNFNRDNAVKLTAKGDLETSVKRDNEKHEIQFATRKLFNLSIESDVFLTPFEVIHLILSVSVNSISVEGIGTVKFNLMNISESEKFQKLSYTKTCTFGNYELAPKLTSTEYTNDRDYYIDEMKLSDEERLNKYK